MTVKIKKIEKIKKNEYLKIDDDGQAIVCFGGSSLGKSEREWDITEMHFIRICKQWEYNYIIPH